MEGFAMYGFLVAERVSALWLVQNKQKRSSFGLSVGDGESEVFIPASEQLIKIIPEECWDFGNDRVYVNPIAVEHSPDGHLQFAPELAGSATLPHALVLLRVQLPGADLTRFELSVERILARATAVSAGGATEQMLVVIRPGESVKAVGYRSGKPYASCQIRFDGKDVIKEAASQPKS
jgi:hypothetical protein